MHDCFFNKAKHAISYCLLVTKPSVFLMWNYANAQFRQTRETFRGQICVKKPSTVLHGTDISQEDFLIKFPDLQSYHFLAVTMKLPSDFVYSLPLVYVLEQCHAFNFFSWKSPFTDALNITIIVHVSINWGADPGFGEGGPQLLRPKVADIAKRSRVSEASILRPGARARLRAWKLLGFWCSNMHSHTF